MTMQSVPFNRLENFPFSLGHGIMLEKSTVFSQSENFSERRYEMKSWKRYFWAALLLVLLVIPATMSAQERKDEWKQSGYAFASMKSVLVQTSFAKDVQADDLKQRILKDKVQANFSRNLKFAQAGLSFLTEEELVQSLSKISGEDVAALAQSDPQQYDKLIREGAEVYCQGILQVRFSIYKDTVRTIPEHMETYETTRRVYFNKVVTASNGSKVTVSEWVDVPVTETKVVPAYDQITAHTAVELTLLDAKSHQPVWKMVDSRDAVEKEKDGMIERILKRASDRLKDVKKS